MPKAAEMERAGRMTSRFPENQQRVRKRKLCGRNASKLLGGRTGESGPLSFSGRVWGVTLVHLSNQPAQFHELPQVRRLSKILGGPKLHQAVSIIQRFRRRHDHYG